MSLQNEIADLGRDMNAVELGELLWECDKDHYEEKPVDIHTYIHDKYFLGSIFGEEFYPFWEDQLKTIYPTPFHSPYYEIIADMPIGSGKTTTALCASISYEIYRLLCLRNPQNYYSILPDTTQIVFCLFSASKSLAEDVNWAVMSSVFETVPWFIKNCPITQQSRAGRMMGVALPKNVAVDLGSSSVHALGKAVFGGALDEANFQRVQSEQANTSYLALLRRMESRFLTAGGHIPGKLWLLSSPKYATDFLKLRIDQSRKSKKTRLIPPTPIWEIQSHKTGLYSGDTFSVYAGDERIDPQILPDPIPLTLQATISPSLTFEVPIEYLESFMKDVYEACREIIGLSSIVASSFIKSPARVKEAMQFPHRFHKEVLELDFYKDEETIVSSADVDYFRNPSDATCLRFIHLDVATKQDRYGAAAVYAKTVRVPRRVDGGDTVMDTVRLFYCDWVLYIKSKPGQEIPLFKFREFMYWLREIRYPVYIITTDQFQSTDTRQLLTRAGFLTGYVSVDRTRDPYITLRNEIYRKRVVLPKCERLRGELVNLVDDGKKIDHPIEGSKDGSDGVAGAYWSASNAERTVKPYTQLNVPGGDDPKSFIEKLRRDMDSRSAAEFAKSITGGANL